MTEGVLDWRPVVGHEDFYEVSDYGHVKRTKRVKGARVGRCLHPACSEADDPKSGYTCGECRSCIARELLAKAS
jgi:hypothetical protein